MKNLTHNGYGGWEPQPYKPIRNIELSDEDEIEDDRIAEEERELAKKHYRPKYIRYGKKII